MGLGFPPGWFQVGWSADLPAGGIVPVRAFGRELVLLRGASGRGAVFDAFCPHMGAHLGHGGCVEGDEVVCPYHGWRWDADGRNTDIPYSHKVNRSLRLRRWECAEADGIVWVWFDPAGGEPFEPVPTTGGSWAAPVATWSWLRCPGEVVAVAESAVDAPHLGRALESEGCVLESLRPTGTALRATHRLAAPAGEPPEEISLDLFGPGAVVVRFGAGDEVHLQTQTPVDDGVVDIRCSAFGGGAGTDPLRWSRYLERALPIWTHLRSDTQPVLPDEEESIGAYRRWLSARSHELLTRG